MRARRREYITRCRVCVSGNSAAFEWVKCVVCVSVCLPHCALNCANLHINWLLRWRCDVFGAHTYCRGVYVDVRKRLALAARESTRRASGAATAAAVAVLASAVRLNYSTMQIGDCSCLCCGLLCSFMRVVEWFCVIVCRRKYNAQHASEHLSGSSAMMCVLVFVCVVRGDWGHIEIWFARSRLCWARL